MTTHDLARETGNAIPTITRWARALGIPKRGRDYQLTAAEAARIRARMQRQRGRPRQADAPPPMT